ncbi:hypothetical protein Syun_025851 [Stephania yunnanensis]|uniref:Uncharacterized protein n=1 Tax=Stephania yunnanensis TaxID=152371 RepID=A0AAP0HW52_9MAGN
MVPPLGSLTSKIAPFNVVLGRAPPLLNYPMGLIIVAVVEQFKKFCDFFRYKVEFCLGSVTKPQSSVIIGEIKSIFNGTMDWDGNGST